MLAALVAGELDDAAVRRDVAAQDREAAGRFERVRERAHDLLAGGLRASAACSPIVRPVTVGASAFSSPASLQALEHERHAAGFVELGGDVLPPGCRSHEQRRALGDRLELVDLAAARPISRATASRCSTPLVEPPLVATAAIAFSSAGLVITSLATLSAAQDVHHQFAALRGHVELAPVLGRHHRAARPARCPSASNAIAIVLAVNWPPHAPAPGEARLLELVQLVFGDLAGGERADRLEDLLDRDLARPCTARA